MLLIDIQADSSDTGDVASPNYGKGSPDVEGASFLAWDRPRVMTLVEETATHDLLNP